MFRLLQNRLGHYLLLIAVSAALFLPGLGAPSLWDIDEGNNAECAQEMLNADNWIVPTFNYELRTDKPAMLYWLQMAAYRQIGINEFAARLPSALASILAVLLTYELGRRLYGRCTGILAGMILASAPAFCASAHFANPDALLNLFTLMTFAIFWRGYIREGSSWFALAGITTGLAMLTKGPVGLVLPAAAIGLFLCWSGQLNRLRDRRLLWGLLTFLLVMGPWYGWVGNDTRWEFLKGFFLKHNLDRFRTPMEGHGGPFFYYIAALFVGLLFWACFLGPALWSAYLEIRKQRPDDLEKNSEIKGRWLRSWGNRFGNLNPSLRFLVCWIGVYIIFFSCSRTKLPNYILPAYPAIALFLAHFLNQWRRGEVEIPGWVLQVSFLLIGVIGVLITVGLIMAGGWLGGATLLRGRHLPGLESWAFLGLVAPFGATAVYWCTRLQRRNMAIGFLTGTPVLFAGLLAVGPVCAVDVYKAPRPLAAIVREQRTDPEIRIATYRFFQPSLVFYCGREVIQLSDEYQAINFLNSPLPVYLFVPAEVWNDLRAKVQRPYGLLGRHRDLYRNWDVVLITNQ